jgi:hypothetical protein
MNECRFTGPSDCWSSSAKAYTHRRIRAGERKSIFQTVIVPADGTIIANVENGNIGTPPFFGQYSGALNRTYIYLGALFSQIAICICVGMSIGGKVQ